MSEAGLVATREPFIDWRAITAGAVLAAGVSITLHAFGSAIGLSIASSSPTWRDASPWLWLISGVFLILVALCAFGFGGYLAGRMRHETRAPLSESQTRDGLHGVIAWALAVLLTAVLAGAAALIGANALSSRSPTASAGEQLLAPELDELFRTDNKIIPDLTFRRAEAARILMKAGSAKGVPAEDRVYLTNVVANYAEADNPDVRVERAVARSKDSIRSARQAGVIQAFMIAAALLLGAAVAWFSAKKGGEDREQRIYPVWRWSFRNPVVPRDVAP